MCVSDQIHYGHVIWKAHRSAARGLGVDQLADRADTSRSRINSYENGRVHPTADTLERVFEVMGQELAATPKLTYEERRSLAISTAVASKLAEDPESVMGKARSNIARMRAAASHEHPWIDVWEALLELGASHVAAVLMSRDQFACDLRQSSPFAGVLSEMERAAATISVQR